MWTKNNKKDTHIHKIYISKYNMKLSTNQIRFLWNPHCLSCTHLSHTKKPLLWENSKEAAIYKMNEWMINRLPIVRKFTEFAFVLVTTGRYLWLVSAKAKTTLKPFRQLSIWIFLKVDVIALFTCVFIDGKIFQNRRVSSPAPVTIVCKRPYSWDFQRGNCFWRSSS